MREKLNITGKTISLLSMVLRAMVETITIELAADTAPKKANRDNNTWPSKLARKAHRRLGLASYHNLSCPLNLERPAKKPKISK